MIKQKRITIYLIVSIASPILIYCFCSIFFYLDKLVYMKMNPDGDRMMCVPIEEMLTIAVTLPSLISLIWLLIIKSKIKGSISDSQKAQIVVIGLLFILPLVLVHLASIILISTKIFEYYSI